MALSFKDFALRNMFWLGNSLWRLLFSFIIPVLCTLLARFPRVYKSEIQGVGSDEVGGENPDDRNQLASEIFGFDSGFGSLYEDENSFDSRSGPNATTSKYEFLAGNSFCGYIEEPRTKSFKVQELFVDSSLEESVFKEQSVCRDLKEFDDQRKTEDSVDQEGKLKGLESVVLASDDEDIGEGDDQVKVESSVMDDSILVRDSGEADDQMKIEDSATSKSLLDMDSGEVDDQVKTENFVTDEPSLEKNSGEADDQVKIENSVTDESFLDKDFEEADRVRMENSVINESLLVKDSGDAVDKVRRNGFAIEGSDCDKPTLDGDFPQKDEGQIRSSILSISSNDDDDDDAHEERAGLQDCIGGRSEEALEEEEEEELISLDPNELSDQDQSLKEENHLRFSFIHVSHEQIKQTNDFWHTNGEFISDFSDEHYSNQSDFAPETPMCLDTRSVDPYEEDISGSDSTDCDSDDDHHQQDSVTDDGDLEMQEKRIHVLDEDDEVDIDVLLEHQSYVQKMKKEMRHLRTIGLPTILEDSESPRMDEDLKPLKINEKVGYKDRLDEVQRFYKTYLDKMKRLDILRHQTMYSVGFLQLKNPDQLAANKKLSLHSVKSLLPHNLLPNKFRRHESDPVQKLIQELNKDLELVYVGQLCLSWEILKWQHSKAEELQLFDTMVLRQYNLAAGEFQQFHVLVQRFTEDEPFLQLSRVENYVKSRCANSNFLQVPPIKDDSKNTEGKAVASIVRLTDIIEESMHAFWELVRTDKESGGDMGLDNPLDAELLSDVKTTLAKKERRIKDLVRSGNCLVKKFKKHKDFQLTHELLVAQVELKLVGRVIGMPRVTADQLKWCHKKLGKISMLGKKVYVESSFSLFPC